MDDQDENKVSRFPSERERRRRMVLRAANDGSKQPPEPMLNLPPAVKKLCLSLVLVYLAQAALPYAVGAAAADGLVSRLGFIPARFTGDMTFDLWAAVSPVTHLFLHGGWMHLGVNTLSLMAFGAGLEKWMGARRMLVIYFLSGLLGALIQLMLSPHMSDPMIGASGAISGLFGALLVAMNDRGILQANVRNPLLIFAGIWMATALFFGFFGVPGAPGEISWATHIGGFVAGMALARPVGRLRI